MVSSRLRGSVNSYISIVAGPLARLGINPSYITLFGLGFSLLAGILYATDKLIFAALALAFSAVLDVIDGAVARLSGKITAFGGFLDSMSDRYSDSIVLIGIALYLSGHYLLIFIVIVGTLMVSYTRARSEMEIEQCDVGFGERAERLIIIIGATFLETVNSGLNVLYWALVLLAILTHATVAQRIWHTYKVLKK
jgi:phosphatidylglycerophosphate synthase